MNQPRNIADSYAFTLVGAARAAFKGYESAVDPTNCAPEIYIQGSLNVYKTLSGTIANRPGRLQRGSVDATLAPVLSSWEWNSSLGVTYPLRVSNGNFQVESVVADGVNPVWYTLQIGVTLPRYVWDAWWDPNAQKDVLVWVHGDATIGAWSGGIALLASATAPVAGTISATTLAAGGTGYKVGDVLTIAGGNGNATAVVTAADISGVIQSFSMTNPGTGYVTNMGSATTTNSQAGAGATINITAVAVAGTITVAGTKTAGQQGLSSGGSITINGHTYTYTFASGNVLYGVTTDASGEGINSVILQTVVINSIPKNTNSVGLPAGGYSNDFCKVIGNRLHIGSYTSRLVYISSSADYTNFTVPSPRVSGSPELLTLDNPSKAISVSKGNAYISAGTKDWYSVSYTQLSVNNVATEQTVVTKQPTAELSAALAHEFVDTIGDNIVYLSQDQQVRNLGTWRNLVSPKVPSLSQAINRELAGEVFIQGFSIGQLRCVGDFIYLTAPQTGKMYLYESREEVDAAGNVVAERLWHAPFINGCAKVAVIGGAEYIHSNSNPQIYKLWNTGQFHDDSPSGPVPYHSELDMSYLNNSFRVGQGMNFFNRVYYEGYMTQNTQLNGDILLELGGARTIQTVVINSNATPATFFVQNPNSLGDDSLGDNPLGTSLNTIGIGQQSLPKFRAIRKVNPVNHFEYGLTVYSDQLDDQWEILCLGANVAINAAQVPGYLTS